ncbi:MAG: DUF4956 domain-containing protein [Sarcina sp.]
MNKLTNFFELTGTTSTSEIGPKTILLSLGAAIVLSAILYITYKHCYDSLTYNKKFNITLIMIAFTSTILMQLIQSNLALSLGMLGSLSIVRFRTGVKDPRDIGFIFWAMAIGISSSTQNFVIGLIGSICMSIFMIIISKTLKAGESLLLVIRGQDTPISDIQNIINSVNGSYKIKAKNVTIDSFELVYEVKFKDNNEDEVINYLLKLEGIDTVNVLAPNTEVV